MSVTYHADIGETCSEDVYQNIMRLRREQGIGIMPDFDAIAAKVQNQNQELLTRTARMNAEQERKNNEVREQSAERDRQRQAAGDALLAKQNAEQQLIHRGQLRMVHIEKLVRDDEVFARLCQLLAPGDMTYLDMIAQGM